MVLFDLVDLWEVGPNQQQAKRSIGVSFLAVG